jgi:MFS family permease
LLWLPRRFDYVFTASIVFAVFGLLIIGLYVRPDKGNAKRLRAATEKRISIGDAFRSLKAPRFLLLTAASSALSLFTLSDNMIYVGLQKQLGFDSAYMPLLFVATAAVFMMLAVPFGRLADRIGSMKIFLTGYGMLALAYGAFAIFPVTGTFTILFYVVLMGAYYAATDGIVAALAVKELPAEAHATGLAFLTSAVSIARMGSSVLFGWLWDRGSQQQAVGMFAVAMVISLLFALTLAMRMKFFAQIKR